MFLKKTLVLIAASLITLFVLFSEGGCQRNQNDYVAPKTNGEIRK